VKRGSDGNRSNHNHIAFTRKKRKGKRERGKKNHPEKGGIIPGDLAICGTGDKTLIVSKRLRNVMATRDRITGKADSGKTQEGEGSSVGADWEVVGVRKNDVNEGDVETQPERKEDLIRSAKKEMYLVERTGGKNRTITSEKGEGK